MEYFKLFHTLKCRLPTEMPAQRVGTYNTALYRHHYCTPIEYILPACTPPYTPTRAYQITQVLEQGQGMDLIEQVSSAGVTANNPLLPPPEKLFGFTYVSFFIEKTTFPASKHNAVMDLTTPTPNVGAFSAMTGTFNFDGKRTVRCTWGAVGCWVALVVGDEMCSNRAIGENRSKIGICRISSAANVWQQAWK